MSDHDHNALTISFAVERALRDVHIEIPQDIIRKACKKALNAITEEPFSRNSQYRHTFDSAIVKAISAQTFKIIEKKLKSDESLIFNINTTLAEVFERVFVTNRQKTVDDLVEKLTSALEDRFSDYD